MNKFLKFCSIFTTIFCCSTFTTTYADNAYTEKRKVIAVVDTGVSKEQSKAPWMCISHGKPATYIFGDTKNPFSDENQRHGENVSGLIGNRIDFKKYCIYSLKVTFHDGHIAGYNEALEFAARIPNIVAVNLSLSSGYSEKKSNYLADEHARLTKIIEHGAKVIVSAGNNNVLLTEDNCNVFPACLQPYYDALGYTNKFIVVGSNTTRCKDKTFCMSFNHTYSNKSDFLQIIFEDGTNVGTPRMTGTSQATATHTGKLHAK